MAEENKNLMTQGPVRRKIVSFAIPIFLGMLFQQMYNTADSLIVGRFIGSNALAAVSSAGNLIFMIVGFFNGISVGAGVVIAHFIGARDEKRTELAVHTTVALGLVSSVLMTLIGVFLTGPILQLMHTPPDVFPESLTYFRIYFAGSVGFVMYNLFVGVLQASGDSRHPLYYLVGASLVNIVLDLVLIAGLGYGVGAAAFATDISQIVSALLAMSRLMRTRASYGLKWSKVRFHGQMLRMIIKNGLPSGLQNSIMSLSNVVIQSYINGYGAAAVAGIGAFVKVEGFAFLPVTSFAMALTTFTSQNLGAGEVARVRKGVRFGVLGACISAELIGLNIMLFAHSLIGFFDTNPEVINYGAQRAMIVGPLFFLCALTHAMASVMRGAGKPTIPMIVFLFCWCFARMGFLAVAEHFTHSIYTTYIVYPITWVLSATVMTICYFRMTRNGALSKGNVSAKEG